MDRGGAHHPPRRRPAVTRPGPSPAVWRCPACGVRGIGGEAAWRGHRLAAHTPPRAVPLLRPAPRPAPRPALPRTAPTAPGGTR